MGKPYLIAEVGVNFFDTAREKNITPKEAAMLYIDAIADAGIDCAKFQTYKAETITSKNSPAYWDTSKESTKSQYELFKKYDSLTEEDYRDLSDYTHSKEIDFISTPFDYESADFLDDMIDFYKISSSDITNLPFIRYIAGKGKPICLSCGASYLSEIDEAVRVMKDAGCNDITLFHCMLSYPTDLKDANLRIIDSLKKTFPDVKIGYSDHVPPDENMTVLTTAYLLGAEVIEKHFTLDKTLEGNDHYHAADPDDFKKAIRNFNIVNNILGSDQITVFDCEKNSRKEARRSLVLNKDKAIGEAIEKDDIIAKRPGYGIAPKYEEMIIGKKVNKNLKEDDILTWDDF